MAKEIPSVGDLHRKSEVMGEEIEATTPGLRLTMVKTAVIMGFPVQGRAEAARLGAPRRDRRMRFVGAFATAAVLMVTNSAEAITPLPSCPAAFVKRWVEHNRRAEIPTPDRTCVMQTETSTYICDQKGCSRAP